MIRHLRVFLLLFILMAHGSFAAEKNQNPRNALDAWVTQVSDVWTAFQLEPQLLIKSHPDYQEQQKIFKRIFEQFMEVLGIVSANTKSEGEVMAAELMFEERIFAVLRARGFNIATGNFKNAVASVGIIFGRYIAFDRDINRAVGDSPVELIVSFFIAHPDIRPLKPTDINANLPSSESFFGKRAALIEQNRLAAMACARELGQSKAN